MPRKKDITLGIESYLIKHGKKGTVFYTELKDNNIAAKAFYHNRKVTTERIIAVNASSTWINFTSKPITRVTLH